MNSVELSKAILKINKKKDKPDPFELFHNFINENSLINYLSLSNTSFIDQVINTDIDMIKDFDFPLTAKDMIEWTT